MRPVSDNGDSWLQIPCTLNSSSEDVTVFRTELHRENRGFKMLYSRCVLSFLALYMMPEASPSVLPSRFRHKREVDWMDQELFPHPHGRSEQGDLSVGDAAVEMDRGVESRHHHPETFLAPTENLTPQRQGQTQFQRKANEKRRKVAPLDSIGSFQMASFRNRKDDP
ncbi:hypothetical protein KUCAC02_000668 [Chaenocephalus aceratus]|uniref:Uncharacterized protein n=1 Tax=Chaenocephalus aceratus TaxID=36190 RepID=A0ACB9W6A6_CHAAC|nr:hypothetical protein KUCAC02_000668 [Chaenocephalus aceratus]